MIDFSLRTQAKSGAGPDLNKPCWTWTDFVSIHEALSPLHTWVLLVLFMKPIYFFAQLISLGSIHQENVSSSLRPALETGCIGLAMCLWSLRPAGLGCLCAGSSGVPVVILLSLGIYKDINSCLGIFNFFFF